MKNINEYLIGDNLEVLSKIDLNFDFCYIDPPYNTGRNFGDFDDTFNNINEFVSFLEPRLRLIHSKLSENGNLVIHIDANAVHYIKVLLDNIFGISNFRNEIIWTTGNQKKVKSKLMRFHDTILVYSKNKAKSIFNQILTPYSEDYISTMKEDARGYYSTSAAKNSQPDVIVRPNLRYDWNGHTFQWWVSKEKMQELHNDNRLEYNNKGIPRIKRYINESGGIPLRDVWTDIRSLQGPEKLGYATQKPVELLERFIKLYSNEGSNCLDIFAGSGTLGRACINTNRNYLLIDINEKGKTLFDQTTANTILKFT
jgi:adenine specific DNA methylase Mod